jgi:hypothetical protein
VVKGPAGSTEAAVARQGYRQVGPVTAVRNVPSRAATASMAIAEQIVTELLLSLGTGR